MHLFHRIPRRHALLAAVVPVAAAAAATLPAAAQAADHPNGFTVARVTDDGTLHVDALSSGGAQGPPPVANNIHLRVENRTLRVIDANDNVLADGTNCFKVTDQEAACTLSKIARIEATLDASFAPAADDIWRSDIDRPTTVSGGRGDDVIVRGFHSGFSRLEVRGGDGFDRIEYLASPERRDRHEGRRGQRRPPGGRRRPRPRRRGVDHGVAPRRLPERRQRRPDRVLRGHGRQRHDRRQRRQPTCSGWGRSPTGPTGSSAAAARTAPTTRPARSPSRRTCPTAAPTTARPARATSSGRSRSPAAEAPATSCAATPTARPR
jgi:hypothetical protein